jgi:hypothetical protein
MKYNLNIFIVFVAYLVILSACKNDSESNNEDSESKENSFILETDSFSLKIEKVQGYQEGRGASRGEKSIKFINQPLKDIIKDLSDETKVNWQLDDINNYSLNLTFESKEENIKNIKQIIFQSLQEFLNFKLSKEIIKTEVWVLEVVNEDLLQKKESKNIKEVYEKTENNLFSISNASIADLVSKLDSDTQSLFGYDGENSNSYSFNKLNVKNLEDLKVQLEQDYGIKMVKEIREIQVYTIEDI